MARRSDGIQPCRGTFSTVRRHIVGPVGRMIDSARAQLARDLDGLAAEYELRGLEPDLVLCRADLGFDDLDREVLPT